MKLMGTTKNGTPLRSGGKIKFDMSWCLVRPDQPPCNVGEIQIFINQKDKFQAMALRRYAVKKYKWVSILPKICIKYYKCGSSSFSSFWFSSSIDYRCLAYFKSIINSKEIRHIFLNFILFKQIFSADAIMYKSGFF